MKKQAYCGFTLSELLITTTIIGILAVTLIPIIIGITPNKSEIMFQKAYYTVGRVVDELINNTELYPDNVTLKGFMNTTTVTENGASYDTPTMKFAQLFASRVNIAGKVDWNTQYNFTTADGITWALPKEEFTISGALQIKVDVQGGTQETNSQTNPNCSYNAMTCQNPDQFDIYVHNDGHLTITGEKEVEYLGG